MFDDSFGDVTSSPFTPVMPSALSSSWDYNKSTLYSEKFTLMGVIEEVLPPSHARNRTKTQYEYIVAAVGELNTHKRIHCILRDHFGGINDFEVFVLKKGQRVTVTCIQGYTDNGLIIGGVKNTSTITDENLGHFYMKRFNKITTSVTKDDTHYTKHDDGNEIRIEKDKIILTDNAHNTITIDKAGKLITITDGSGETITIDKTSGKITIAAKDLNLNVTGKLKATVKGDAEIKAKNIKLNGSGGKVLTTKTHGVDYVTGLPIRGVRNVKAG